MMTSQVCIGFPVLVHPGVLIPHGQVVIDGITEIESGVALRPWVTIGLIDKVHQGPTIGKDVKIGTGAKVLGPVVVGDRARIGANAVVLDDVKPDVSVVGAPAHGGRRDSDCPGRAARGPSAGRRPRTPKAGCSKRSTR